MSRKQIRYWAICGIAGLLTGGCGLLPDIKPSMSNAEKATLNLQMGARYLDMGMLDAAREKLQTALSLDSGNAEIHNTLAVFYERVKDYDAADDSYRSALSRDPANFSTLNNYGRFQCERDRVDQGVELLKQALDSAMNTRPWFALTNLGACALKQNDAQQAEGYFRQALQAQSEYAPALLEMQKISYQNRQYLSARGFLERYLAVANHTPETLWLAFQTERSLGNGKLAEEYRDKLLSAFPASKEAQLVKSAISK